MLPLFGLGLSETFTDKGFPSSIAYMLVNFERPIVALTGHVVNATQQRHVAEAHARTSFSTLCAYFVTDSERSIIVLAGQPIVTTFQCDIS